MFLGKAEALVSGVRQLLFPELSITAAIYLPVNIFGLQHKNTVARDNNMVNLCGVIAVANQKVIVNPVVIAVQILQEWRHPLFAVIADGFCPTAIFVRKQRGPESLFLLYCATWKLRLSVFLTELLTLDALYDRLYYQIENEST